MSPGLAFSEVNYGLGPIATGMLQDMGYDARTCSSAAG